MRTPAGRLLLAGLVAVTGLASVAGCSSRAELLGLAANDRVSTGAVTLSPAHAEAITRRALTFAQQADASRSASAARTAFTGLALRTAAASYAVGQVVDPGNADSGVVLAPPPPPSRLILTSGTSYPRSFVALSRPAGSSTDEVALLVSPDARTPYRIASRARLLPGAKVPSTGPSEHRAQTLADDAPGLVATPAEAVRDYAKLLQTGVSSGTTFAPDSLVAGVRANATGQARGVAKIATFTQRHVVTDDPIQVLRTADGGALVLAAIERTDDFAVKKGAGYLTPPAAYKALAGGLAKITRQATVTTVQVVVIVLPATGRGAARLVAAAELPFTIKAS